MLIDRALVEAALPGYQVEGDLGKGGYGLVLAGQHKLIGRKVAIKILLDTSDDPDLRERFLSEARVLAELDHPHIVRIHDYVEYQGTCLLVMELLPGGTLKQRMSGGPMSRETTCALGLAAAAALATAHSHGVLHRDVKPDNMMFAGDGLLKVTDFGIAKIFDGAETTASAILGTPRYMAPEQIMGSRLFPSTDLYALAGVLYEIFAGRPLFGRQMAVQPLTHHHLSVAPEPLTMIPEPLSAVVMRSLAKEPSARHGDAGDFALDLARAALRSFGPNWMQRADIKVRLDDDVREAALGTSTTPNPPMPIPGAMPGPRPTGPGPYRGPMPPAGGTPQPGPLPAGGPARPGPGYGPYPGPPGPGRPQPATGPSTPTPAGWPGHAQRPGPTAPNPSQQPYRPAQPAAAGPGPFAQTGTRPNPDTAGRGGPGWAGGAQYQRPPMPAGGQQWAGSAPAGRRATGSGSGPGHGGTRRAPQRLGPGGLPMRTWWVIAGLVFALVVGLTVSIVLAASGGGDNTAEDRKDIPGTGYAGGVLTTDLDGTYSVALDSAGTLYVVDSGNSQIRTVTAGGTVGNVAGAGVPGMTGDGGKAVDARLNSPGSVAIGPDGSLYIGDSRNHQIRKVDPAGIITTVAGNGSEGYSGDGGPATASQLASPERVAVDDDGNIYIADYGNHRIRKVDAAGIITTIAGNGTEGFSGAGGPATQAQLNFPNDVTVADDGTIYFVNLGSDTIQKIGLDGTLSTVAGTGEEGYSGDGGPATAAQLANPAVDLARDGTIYVPDYFNHRVRKIDLNGTITTVAGNGTEPEEGDPAGEGGRAVDAQVVEPSGVAIDESGALYISDTANVRVLRVGTDGIITTVLRAS